MYELIKIDITRPHEPKYVAYYYNKRHKWVYEVTSNGETSALSVRDQVKLSNTLHYTAELPKYITDKLITND